MTIAQRASEIVKANEINQASMEFARLAQAIMVNRGSVSEAAAAAEMSSRNGNLGPKLAGILKVARMPEVSTQKSVQNPLTLSGGARLIHGDPFKALLFESGVLASGAKLFQHHFFDSGGVIPTL